MKGDGQKIFSNILVFWSLRDRKKRKLWFDWKVEICGTTERQSLKVNNDNAVEKERDR